MAARCRGFDSVDDHNEAIISNINSRVGGRDKLFVLGDAVWNSVSLGLLKEINGVKELVFGNHDTLAVSR